MLVTGCAIGTAWPTGCAISVDGAAGSASGLKSGGGGAPFIWPISVDGAAGSASGLKSGGGGAPFIWQLGQGVPAGAPSKTFAPQVPQKGMAQREGAGAAGFLFAHELNEHGREGAAVEWRARLQRHL